MYIYGNAVQLMQHFNFPDSFFYLTWWGAVGGAQTPRGCPMRVFHQKLGSCLFASLSHRFAFEFRQFRVGSVSFASLRILEPHTLTVLADSYLIIRCVSKPCAVLSVCLSARSIRDLSKQQNVQAVWQVFPKDQPPEVCNSRSVAPE